MKIFRNPILGIYIYLATHEKRFRAVVLASLKKLREGLSKESHETKEMLETYYRYTKGLASKKEMDEANEQFQDLLRALGLGVFIVLPFAPITIPFVVQIGKKLGINILPSSFREQNDKITDLDKDKKNRT
jgi:hypothetical protein